MNKIRKPQPLIRLMKKLILALFLVSAPASQAMANDGVYYTSGSTLVPLKETDIAVRKEVLEITLRKDGYADVSVDYTLYNNSDDKTVTMAFEAAPPYNANEPLNHRGIHPSIKNFTVLFNGKRLTYRNAVVADDNNFTPIDLSQWKGYGETPDSIDLYDDRIYNERLDSIRSFAYAYYFDAPFEKGENRVRHTYRYRMSWGVGRDYELTYALTPITRWQGGQVDDFTLRIKSETDREIIMNDSIFLSEPFTLKGIGETYQLQSDYWGYSECLFAPLLVGNVLEWHGKNFAPTENLHIEPLELLKGGKQEYRGSGRVVVEKDGHESRYIADSGSNYFVEVQDYGFVPKEGARVELRASHKGQGYVFLKSDVKRANVRQEPSMKGKVLFTIDNDGEIPEYYPCLGFTSHKEADGMFKWWYKVEVNGKVGYISEKLVIWDSIRL